MPFFFLSMFSRSNCLFFLKGKRKKRKKEKSQGECTGNYHCFQFNMSLYPFRCLFLWYKTTVVPSSSTLQNRLWLLQNFTFLNLNISLAFTSHFSSLCPLLPLLFSILYLQDSCLTNERNYASLGAECLYSQGPIPGPSSNLYYDLGGCGCSHYSSPRSYGNHNSNSNNSNSTKVSVQSGSFWGRKQFSFAARSPLNCLSDQATTLLTDHFQR